MTREELYTAVRAVIEGSLDADFWTENAAKQTAALNSASNDILSRVPSVTLADLTADNSNIICAVAEQAVYLLRTHDAHADGTEVASESVDGVSMTYAHLGGSDGIISPRALAYLEQAQAEAKRAAMKKVRFIRG